MQGIGLLATACLSFGSGLLGFSINLHKDLALAGKDVDPDILHWWDKIQYPMFTAGAIFVVVGIIAFLVGKHKVHVIKQETEFD